MRQATCEHGLAAGDILAAIDEGIDVPARLDPQAAAKHASACGTCREALRLRKTARSAWTTTALFEAAAEPPRAHDALRRAWQEGRSSRTRRPLRVVAILAPALAAAALALGARVVAPSRTTEAPTASHAAPPVVPPTPTTHLTAPPTAPVAAAVAAQARRSVIVPAGSRVTLGFAIAPDALEGSVEVVGPASGHTTDASLTLDHGTIHVRGLKGVTIHLPGADLDPNGATCTVNVDPRGDARVSVEQGSAIVSAGADAGVVTIDAGASMAVTSRGSFHVSASAPIRAVVTPRPSPPPPVQGEASLSTARDRFRGGDVSARADLERLAASGEAAVARRAAFTLAEMDLINGDRPQAQSRLRALVTCPEPALGADAATLLARSLPPSERPGLWKRYLETNPPAPYHDRAQLDHAEALLDSGQAPQARRLLDEVKQSRDLTDAQRRQLERLLFKARELH